MADRLGAAGISFGRAFCVPPDMDGMPLDQLPEDIRECVQRVGLGYERRVERAFAGGGGNPDSETNPDNRERQRTRAWV